MEKYIKYKRHEKSFLNKGFEDELQEWLDSLVVEGWEIINYHENHKVKEFNVIILTGKKQSNVL